MGGAGQDEDGEEEDMLKPSRGRGGSGVMAMHHHEIALARARADVAEAETARASEQLARRWVGGRPPGCVHEGGGCADALAGARVVAAERRGEERERDRSGSVIQALRRELAALGERAAACDRERTEFSRNAAALLDAAGVRAAAVDSACGV